MADQNKPAAGSGHKAVSIQEHGPGIKVKWYVDALIEGHVYHGFIKYLSLYGTEIFLDLNLSQVKTIRLRIHVPPPSRTSQPRFIETAGDVLFTSYDSKEAMFHIGVHFTGFKEEADRHYLESRIAAFNKTK